MKNNVILTLSVAASMTADAVAVALLLFHLTGVMVVSILHGRLCLWLYDVRRESSLHVGCAVFLTFICIKI